MGNQSSLDQILQQYPVEVKEVEENPLYYKLSTNKGTKILKRWDSPKELQLHFQYREDLARAGFRKIDRFIRDSRGNPYIIQGLYGFSLTDHITGKIPTTSNNDLIIAAKTIAEFHLASAKVEVKKQWKAWSPQYLRGLKHFQRIEEQLKEKKQKEPIDETVQSHITNLIETTRESVELVEKLERNLFRNGAQPQWIHGSLKLSSLRIDPYQEGWLSHLPLPIFDIPVYDLAKLSNHIYQKSNFDIDKISVLLEEYQQWIPMEKIDKQWMIAYLSFPHDLWKFLYSYYIAGIKPVSINMDAQLKELIGLNINQAQLVNSLFSL